MPSITFTDDDHDIKIVDQDVGKVLVFSGEQVETRRLLR